MSNIKWKLFLNKKIFPEYLIDPFDEKYKLIPDLIPSTTWFENARKHLKDDWDNLRKDCYKKAGYICEICNGKGPTHPVEAHEVFSYDYDTKIQKLERLIALCPMCHKVKHAGLWVYVKKQANIVVPHMAKINNISIEESIVLLTSHMDIHSYRSNIDWTVDLSSITNKDV